ncbi:MAG: carboxypeptidase-like regulatory domain-containing protein, partial [Acidobacteriota bacterium]
SGNFLQSWTAAASGTFASNPPPNIFLVTAASVSLSGRVLTSKGAGLRNAQVLLTDMNGRVRTAVSSSFGNFMFDGLESGQSYVVSVRSKQFTFSPKFVSLSDSLTGLDLVADF